MPGEARRYVVSRPFRRRIEPYNGGARSSRTTATHGSIAPLARWRLALLDIKNMTLTINPDDDRYAWTVALDDVIQVLSVQDRDFEGDQRYRIAVVGRVHGRRYFPSSCGSRAAAERSVQALSYILGVPAGSCGEDALTAPLTPFDQLGRERERLTLLRWSSGRWGSRDALLKPAAGREAHVAADELLRSPQPKDPQ